MANLNNVATQDDYSSSVEFTCSPTVGVTLTVANAAAYFRSRTVKLTGINPSGESEGPEILLMPGNYKFDASDFDNGKCVGMRFRSAAAGVPARITVFS